MNILTHLINNIDYFSVISRNLSSLNIKHFWPFTKNKSCQFYVHAEYFYIWLFLIMCIFCFLPVVYLSLYSRTVKLQRNI